MVVPFGYIPLPINKTFALVSASEDLKLWNLWRINRNVGTFGPFEKPISTTYTRVILSNTLYFDPLNSNA